jgi:hypothetical protein
LPLKYLNLKLLFHRKTTENLKELISQQKKATEDFNKLQRNQKEQMKKLMKDRSN